ncbi:MAG: LysM peptidoglycan-binding domain-containing protein [Spirochaetales bacterium]|nr:MAG: LysM peptidoglycan-binding domain-containing protein [Spirochaetales bacterium]
MKATGMYAIAGVALFVFSGEIYCAPPRSMAVREGRRVHSMSEDTRMAREMTIIHRWDEQEAVYGDSGFDYSGSPEGYEDIDDPGDEDDGNRHGQANREYRPGNAKKEQSAALRTRGGAVPEKKEKTPSERQRTIVERKTASVIFYTVKKNDTLYSLTKRQGCTLGELYKLNGLKKGDSIKVGMKLRLPSKGICNSEEKAVVASPPSRENINFRWPLPRVLTVRRDSAEGVKPLGLEITSKPGSTVVSAASGIVKRIGDMRGYGRYVIISHNERFVTVYSRMGEITVREGERISSGTVIGKIDDGSRSIHFQIGRAGKPVDPLRYLPERS